MTTSVGHLVLAQCVPSLSPLNEKEILRFTTWFCHGFPGRIIQQDTFVRSWYLQTRFCSMMFLQVLSLPSILFAIAQTLPAQNTSGLNPNMLSGVHMAAPYLIVFIDVWIAMPLSTIYSKRSGIERSRLVMTLRLFSAWFLSLLTTTFLHENCFGGWKFFWAVCQKNAPERHFFEWNLWDEELLNPTTDMCSVKFSWPQGRCTRSVVDGLTSLLLKKLLFRSIGMPLLTMLSWCLSRPQDSEETEDGRHLLFMGCWPVTTNMLKPYNQVTLLTTYLEVLFFWSPFIPLLSVGVLFLAAANLFLLDIGVWQFGFRAPTDARNSNATLSKGYLAMPGKGYGPWVILSSTNLNLGGRSKNA